MKYKQNYTSVSKRRFNNNNNNNNSDNNGFHVNNNQNGTSEFNNSNSRNNNNTNLNNDANQNSDEYGKTRKCNNTKSNQSESSAGDSDDNEDDMFDHKTPLFGHEQLSIYSSVPNRLTPSRRDSYRTTSSSSSSCGEANTSSNRTPFFSAKSIFEFSNSISQQKRLDDNRHESDSDSGRHVKSATVKQDLKSVDVMSESSCDQEIIETFKKSGEQQARDLVKNAKHPEKVKTEKGLGFQTPTIPVKKSKSIKSANGESCSPSPSPTMNTPTQTSTNKKRKAKDSESGSSANSSLISTSQVSFEVNKIDKIYIRFISMKK